MDNSELGKLQHSCWTYWGHSGAGLFEVKNSKLVGLHSSWDGDEGTRHGVHLDALKKFLSEYVTVAAVS
jgi:V8-like Glu-specific endopeptidase